MDQACCRTCGWCTYKSYVDAWICDCPYHMPLWSLQVEDLTEKDMERRISIHLNETGYTEGATTKQCCSNWIPRKIIKKGMSCDSCIFKKKHTCISSLYPKTCEGWTSTE